LVWFQGWSDVIDDQKAAEYGSNLANFIRDVRLDLNLPRLPVVLGELGQAGSILPNAKQPHLEFRRQMRKVTEQPAFVGNTRYVMTSLYINSLGESFNGDLHYYGRADTEFYIGRAFGTAMIQLLEDYQPIRREVNTKASSNKEVLANILLVLSMLLYLPVVYRIIHIFISMGRTAVRKRRQSTATFTTE
jgi:hypothetical protein